MFEDLFSASTIFNQYIIIAIAVAVLFALKAYMSNKAYQNKLKSFIHPETIIQDIKKKFKSVEDAQNVLSYNILKLEEDYSRVRNIAFLIAYLKQSKVPVDPLKGKMMEMFKKLDQSKMIISQKSYRDYILIQIGAKQTSRILQIEEKTFNQQLKESRKKK